MEQIWAPWRIHYILEGYKGGGCLFCDVRREDDDKKHFVLERASLSLVMFNLYPYNNAHLMCAPFRHVSGFEDLDDGEMLEMGRSIQKWVKVIKKVMKPDGFNIGLNLGKVAGAGFEGHLHYHVVPRWNGDTNFMPVIAGTKVLSESLDATYEKLLEASRGEAQ
jgi:ATP adenylyltransferase